MMLFTSYFNRRQEAGVSGQEIGFWGDRVRGFWGDRVMRQLSHFPTSPLPHFPTPPNPPDVGGV
ncbi:MAG: hypothetical protein ACKPGO_00075, partial [Microcystis panniformis]